MRKNVSFALLLLLLMVIGFSCESEEICDEKLISDSAYADTTQRTTDQSIVNLHGEILAESNGEFLCFEDLFFLGGDMPVCAYDDCWIKRRIRAPGVLELEDSVGVEEFPLESQDWESFLAYFQDPEFVLFFLRCLTPLDRLPECSPGTGFDHHLILQWERMELHAFAQSFHSLVDENTSETSPIEPIGKMFDALMFKYLVDCPDRNQRQDGEWIAVRSSMEPIPVRALHMYCSRLKNSKD